MDNGHRFASLKLEPKKLLVTSKSLTDYLKEVFDSEQFHRGVEVALVQMQLDMPLASDQVQAVANAYRLEGAKMFLGKLMNVTDMEAPPEKRAHVGKLNPNA